MGIAGTHELSQAEPLIPSARERIPGLPNRPATDSETDRFLVMAATVRLLALLGQTRPVVLVLDDLHWADDATLAMLRGLASAESMRVLVIGTYRDSELGPDSPLTDCLAQLRREPDVARVPLGGLDESELADLVAAIAGHDLALDDTTQRLLVGLHDESNGNPFFAIEILRYLAGTGDLLRNASGRWEARDGLDFAELPDSIREVVAARVERVGSSVARVLAAAAVIGVEFELPVLALVLGEDEELILDRLEAAEEGGLLDPVGNDRFGFAHALIANALVQGVNDVRRATLHRRVAEAYEQLGLAESQPGEVAVHWLAARGEDTSSRVLECGAPRG